MKPILAAEFARRVGGEAIGFAPEATISTFCLDSNAVQPGDLFLAIKGARADGHDFVPSVLSSGAVGTLAERTVEGPHVLVKNLVNALADLASYFRMQFDGPVIGITGSAGKTTTKEFVASTISSLGPVLKTPGNRNSEYTSPLLWTDLEDSHRAVVVEMAMRGFNQIEHLASFSRPQVGIVTNIGYAHMEMVGSRHGIAEAKGELLEALPAEGAAILWNEDDLLEWLRPKSAARAYTFGFEPGADCQITQYRAVDWHSSILIGTCAGKPWETMLPVAGRHIALNAAAAILTAAILGIEPDVAAKNLEGVVLPPMRMEVVNLNGATILLDNYNASPPSMIAAIETLADLPVQGKRFAVVGEMRELGEYTEAAHRNVGQTLGRAGFDRVIFYGPSTSVAIEEAVANGLPQGAISVATSIKDVEEFLTEMQPGDAGMIKGSRALELERALKLEGHK